MLYFQAAAVGETVVNQQRFGFVFQGWKDDMTQLEIKADAELDGPLRFEMLLAKISTFFINLPAMALPYP